MTAKEIKNRIAECSTLFGFEYRGVPCNIDPCYHGNDRFSFLLFCNGKEKTVDSVDDAMQSPFFCGKSLDSIANEIIVTED